MTLRNHLALVAKRAEILLSVTTLLTIVAGTVGRRRLIAMLAGIAMTSNGCDRRPAPNPTPAPAPMTASTQSRDESPQRVSTMGSRHEAPAVTWNVPARGPPHCPVCDSEDVLPIAYGLVVARPRDAAIRGEVWLGGCMVRHANRHCVACGTEWQWRGETDSTRPVVRANGALRLDEASGTAYVPSANICEERRSQRQNDELNQRSRGSADRGNRLIEAEDSGTFVHRSSSSPGMS